MPSIDFEEILLIPDLMVMAYNLRPMASNLEAMASNLTASFFKNIADPLNGFRCGYKCPTYSGTVYNNLHERKRDGKGWNSMSFAESPNIAFARFFLLKPRHLVLSFSEKAFPRLTRWYAWLERSQRSDHRASCFRWKGRTAAHCLASGLDDYPRGLYVNSDECHLDLHSWMLFFARTDRDECGIFKF